MGEAVTTTESSPHLIDKDIPSSGDASKEDTEVRDDPKKKLTVVYQSNIQKSPEKI